MRCRPALVIIENDHLLLMKYVYGSQEIYNLPGGNPDEGELFPETIVRECQEELAIEVEVGALLLMGEMPASKNRAASLHIIFQGKIISGIPILQEKETTAKEIIWMPIAEISKNLLYPNVGEELQDLIFLQKSGKYIGKIQQPWIE
ncbi:NUDIX domain-containing protein [Aquirufa sp. ROCK-SH2]